MFLAASSRKRNPLSQKEREMRAYFSRKIFLISYKHNVGCIRFDVFQSTADKTQTIVFLPLAKGPPTRYPCNTSTRGQSGFLVRYTPVYHRRVRSALFIYRCLPTALVTTGIPRGPPPTRVSRGNLARRDPSGISNFDHHHLPDAIRDRRFAYNCARVSHTRDRIDLRASNNVIRETPLIAHVILGPRITPVEALPFASLALFRWVRRQPIFPWLSPSFFHPLPFSPVERRSPIPAKVPCVCQKCLPLANSAQGRANWHQLRP